MSSQHVEVPGYGVVEFPSDMSDDDIVKAIKGFNSEDKIREISGGESLARGALQGATLGHADEITGALQTYGGVGEDASPELLAALEAERNKTKDLAKGQGKSAYEYNRDLERTANSDSLEANPKLYGTGELAGNIASTAFLPGGSLLKAAGSGAAAGAVQGAGTSTTDNYVEIAKDAATGAAAGGVGGSVGYGIGKGINKVVQKIPEWQAGLRDSAYKRAFKAIGGERSAARKLREEGSSPEEIGEYVMQKQKIPKVDSLGQDIPGQYEEKAILSPFASEQVVEKTTQRINDYNNDILKLVYDTNDLSKVNPLSIIQKLQKQRDTYAVPGTAQAAANRQLDKMINLVNNYGQEVEMGGYLPVAKARELMQKIADNTKFRESADAAANLKNEVGQQARRDVRGEVVDSIKAKDADIVNTLQPGETLDDIGYTPTRNDSFESANNNIAKTIKVKEILDKQADKSAGNNFFGLSNILSAGAGATVGGYNDGSTGALTGAALVLGARKLIEKYGGQISALALKKVGSLKLPNVGDARGLTSATGSLIGRESAQSDTDVNYGSPGEEQTVQAAPQEMKDKNYEAVSDLLNQTDPNYRMKLYNEEEDEPINSTY